MSVYIVLGIVLRICKIVNLSVGVENVIFLCFIIFMKKILILMNVFINLVN